MRGAHLGRRAQAGWQVKGDPRHPYRACMQGAHVLLVDVPRPAGTEGGMSGHDAASARILICTSCAGGVHGGVCHGGAAAGALAQHPR